MNERLEKYRRRGFTGTRKKVPNDAEQRLFEAAKSGASMQGLADCLGVSRDLLVVWREQHPELQEAIERGREKEHHDLHNALYMAAMHGNVVAAIFLLKARHGYREGDQGDTANRVSINFALPGAMKLEDFGKVVEVRQERLEHDD